MNVAEEKKKLLPVSLKTFIVFVSIAKFVNSESTLTLYQVEQNFVMWDYFLRYISFWTAKPLKLSASVKLIKTHSVMG